MKTLPGVMVLAVGLLTAQLVAIPASASSLKYFENFSRQSSQSLTLHHFDNQRPVVGPKSPWTGDFATDKREHLTSVFDGLDADKKEQLSALRDALRQSFLGDGDNLHKYIGELSGDKSDGHRFVMGVDRFDRRFIEFTEDKANYRDSINSKNIGAQSSVVPIPSAIWLMVSSLLVIGYRAKSRNSDSDSNGMAEGCIST
jgi:hypothetical protein